METQLRSIQSHENPLEELAKCSEKPGKLTHTEMAKPVEGMVEDGWEQHTCLSICLSVTEFLRWTNCHKMGNMI